MKKLFAAGELLFLLGIAFLIIRNNAYSWPLKRASDILFFGSLFLASWHLFKLSPDRRLFFLKAIRPYCIAITVIFLAILAATWNMASQHLIPSAKVFLDFSRFLEAGALMLLAGYFTTFDSTFFKKFAISQLSTLVYIFFLWLPDTSLQIAVDRFKPFENWPSNVSYYLLVSLSFALLSAYASFTAGKKQWLLWYAASVHLFATFLWALTRASWLAFALTTASVFVLYLYHRTSARHILISGLLVVLLLPLGFFILPRKTQGIVQTRIIGQHSLEAPPQPTGATTILQQENRIPLLSEASRLYLWRAYTEKVLRRPWGEGLTYQAVQYETSARGPHNTPLEILITGGVVALAGYLYLFQAACRQLFVVLRSRLNFQHLYLFCALLSLSIASMFDNMSTFRLMWIVLGLTIFSNAAANNLDANSLAQRR